MIWLASVSVIYYEVSTTSGMYACPSHARLHDSGSTYTTKTKPFIATMVYETMYSERWYTKPFMKNDGIQTHSQRTMMYKTTCNDWWYLWHSQHMYFHFMCVGRLPAGLGTHVVITTNALNNDFARTLCMQSATKRTNDWLIKPLKRVSLHDLTMV